MKDDRRLLRLVIVVLAVVGTVTTTGRTDAYGYDVSCSALVSVLAPSGPEASPVQPSVAWEKPISPSVGPGDTSTTPLHSVVATEAVPGASNTATGARLNGQLRLTERCGAGGVRELSDGRLRFCGEVTPAKTPGEMAGARLVREWDPATGLQRTWYETLDQAGNVRMNVTRNPGRRCCLWFCSPRTRRHLATVTPLRALQPLTSRAERRRLRRDQQRRRNA